jgi:hypothetical protein
MKTISRRTFLRNVLGVVAGAAIATPLGYWYVSDIEPRWLAVERLTLRLPRLPKAFDGLTLAHLSDLHAGPIPTPETSQSMVREAVKAAINLQTEVIVITGDFVRRKGAWENVLEELLKPLNAPLGMFGVRGNHDWWNGPDLVNEIARRAGIQMLNNSWATLSRNGEVLHIVGLDSAYENHENWAQAVSGLPENATAFMLAHEPDMADVTAQDARFILQLSGHSHGGQVQLPLVKPNWIPKLGRKYPRGHYHVSGLQLYTNRGVGVVGVPVRFNCRPEVTHITVRAG